MKHFLWWKTVSVCLYWCIPDHYYLRVDTRIYAYFFREREKRLRDTVQSSSILIANQEKSLNRNILADIKRWYWENVTISSYSIIDFRHDKTLIQRPFLTDALYSPKIEITILTSLHIDPPIHTNLSINKCKIVRSIILHQNERKIDNSNIQTSAYFDHSSIYFLQIDVNIITFTFVCYFESW